MQRMGEVLWAMNTLALCVLRWDESMIEDAEEKPVTGSLRRKRNGGCPYQGQKPFLIFSRQSSQLT
jgi:hypothetical protein